MFLNKTQKRVAALRAATLFWVLITRNGKGGCEAATLAVSYDLIMVLLIALLLTWQSEP